MEDPQSWVCYQLINLPIFTKTLWWNKNRELLYLKIESVKFIIRKKLFLLKIQTFYLKKIKFILNYKYWNCKMKLIILRLKGRDNNSKQNQSIKN